MSGIGPVIISVDSEFENWLGREFGVPISNDWWIWISLSKDGIVMNPSKIASFGRASYQSVLAQCSEELDVLCLSIDDLNVSLTGIHIAWVVCDQSSTPLTSIPYWLLLNLVKDWELVNIQLNDTCMTWNDDQEDNSKKKSLAHCLKIYSLLF